MKSIIFIVSGFALTSLFSANIVKAQQINPDELKTNISKVTHGLSTIKQLEPISFHYDSNKARGLGNRLPTGNQLGFLTPKLSANSQVIIKTDAYITSTGKNSSKVNKVAEVDKTALIPLLVAAIQEQQAQIETLQKELLELRAQKEQTE